MCFGGPAIAEENTEIEWMQTFSSTAELCGPSRSLHLDISVEAFSEKPRPRTTTYIPGMSSERPMKKENHRASIVQGRAYGHLWPRIFITASRMIPGSWTEAPRTQKAS